jgi:hypothetical protein
MSSTTSVTVFLWIPTERIHHQPSPESESGESKPHLPLRDAISILSPDSCPSELLDGAIQGGDATELLVPAHAAIAVDEDALHIW